jgi:uncharacterized membrane protein (DUF106 family)
MTDLLLRMLAGINAVANAAGELLQAPVAACPGWLSLTVMSAAVGVLALIVFKYTSNQQAIGRVRDDIKANLLAVKLYRDSFSVAMKSQTRVLTGACRLLLYSLVPMLVLIGPVCLVLAQMGSWYQARPLRPEDGQVTVQIKMKGSPGTLPLVTLDSLPAARLLTGPVRVSSRGEIYFTLRPLENGTHTLIFHVGDGRYEKQMVIGNGFMRVSPKRPGASPWDVLMYPLETPFASGDLVQSISIAYPPRDSMMYGTDWWVIYFFLASMAFAFLAKPFLKVRI